MSATKWRTIGASVVGVSHTAHGTPCQDAHAYRLLPGDVLAVAVADGAGSAPRSDEGAQAAVEAALDALERIAQDEGPERLFDSSQQSSAPEGPSEAKRVQDPLRKDWSTEVISFDGPSTTLDEVELGAFDPALAASDIPDDSPSDHRASPTAMRQAFANAIAAVEALAAESATRSRDFACTLTCVLANESTVVVGQVGDCVAVVKDSSGSWTTVGMPQKEGEYANEAFFITQPDSFDRLEIESFEIAAEAIVLSTDGLLRLMLQLPAMAPHPPFLDPIVRFAERTTVPAPLAAFLDSDRVNARTDDDKTLVIALRQTRAADDGAREKATDKATGSSNLSSTEGPGSSTDESSHSNDE